MVGTAFDGGWSNPSNIVMKLWIPQAATTVAAVL